MSADNGWEPLSKPKRSEGATAFVVSPFTRLARTHAAAVAGMTLVVFALADSLFFSIDPTAARSRIALYLLLTMAPFAVVAPLIGPALDRMKGGRRLMVIGANALRVVICVMMMRDLDSLWLFPEAFTALVADKSYHVSKSAIVPTVVRSDAELVAANSRLSFLSGVVGFAAFIPGGLSYLVAGSQGVLLLAAAIFVAATVFGAKVPATQVATDHTSQTERQELRGGGIVLAASAMGLLRGVVGFLFFLIAFALRTSGAPLAQFGLVAAASGIGALLGALVAPILRRNMAEERMLQIVLAGTAVAGLLAAWQGGLAAAAGLALCVGMAASSGKLAFDSVVQRDAPDANRGRSFARFETRFQLMWVVGAFIPVVIPIPQAVGFLVIAGCATFAVVTYAAGLRALARGEIPTKRSPTQVLASRLKRKRQGYAVDPTTAPPDRPTDAAQPSTEAQGPPPVDGEPGADLPALPDQRNDPPPAAPPAPRAPDDAEPPTHARDNVIIDPTNL
jgi:hypothetical protein